MKIGYLVRKNWERFYWIKYLTSFFSIVLVEVNFETWANGYSYTWLGL